MDDLSFQIGKELGELRARVSQLEAKANCGCKGKAKTAKHRFKCEAVKAALSKMASALSELKGIDGVQTHYIKRVVFSSKPQDDLSLLDWYCCNDRHGNNYCCDTDDPGCDIDCDS